jgi:hypothetical protein
VSYVVTIQRSHNSLSTSEMEQAVGADTEFVTVGNGCWRWVGVPGGSELFLNLGDDNLWTDGGRGWIEPIAIDKLRSLAKTLDARVVGEEGEELTENAPVKGQPVSPTGTFLTLLITVALIPVIALVAIVRLPLVLWQIVRRK